MSRADEEAQITKNLAGYMLRKLRQNSHKQHWRNETIPELLEKMKREIIELEEAIQFEPFENVVNEAADVANFCAMIIDNVSMLEETKKEASKSWGSH